MMADFFSEPVVKDDRGSGTTTTAEDLTRGALLGVHFSESGATDPVRRRVRPRRPKLRVRVSYSNSFAS
jgi:hypothetical protein